MGSSIRGDVGPEVVDFVFSSMRIDGRWSIREPRGFTWWGHRLAQRIWADTSRSSLGDEIVQVHAATSLLKGVPDAPRTRGQLALLNCYASLSALTWSPREGRVLLHCAATFHRENIGHLKSLFLAAVGLQAADAHIKADGLARLLGGEVDVASHPESGEREQADEILDIIDRVFAPAGARPSPFTEMDFKAGEDMNPRPWVMASSDATGLVGQFPFTGSTPAGLGNNTETALFTAAADQPHPQLGSGALLTLRVPVHLSQEQAWDIAWTLNLLEMTEPGEAHLLGAWGVEPTPPGHPATLMFSSFLPAVVHKPGLIAAMVMVMAVRTRELADRYLQGTAPAARSLEDMQRLIGAAKEPERLADLTRAVSAGEDALRVAAALKATEQQALADLWARRPPVAEVRCWSCKTPLPVTDDTRGKKVRCPRCGTRQALPR